MSIFRDTFQSDIKTQMTKRQERIGQDPRTSEVLQQLNSRNAWIRMTSSVNVGGSDKYAKSYVLQGGTLNGDKLKTGIGSTGTEAYSTQTPLGTTHKLGIRPMPGITGIDVKSKSAYGSLREITVNFQCWDIHQLEELELLYMRPGYTVLVEWGWTPYIDNSDTYKSNFTDYYDIINKGKTERSVVFKALYDKSTQTHNGNYDAMFGYIKNYQWSAREDGGYDCQTIVISTGEIIESLKINYLKANLTEKGLYDVSSKGKGLLDELFDKQGNTPSSDFASHYEKNVLAGTWAELFKKLKDSANVPRSTLGKEIIEDYCLVKMPGLNGAGDFTSMVEPQSDYQVYIPLRSVFKVLNEYIIGKDSSGEPLIKLSTRANTYSSDGSNLLCIAHPLQISTDPLTCVIKNPLWEDLMADVVASTTPILNAIQIEADAIVKALIDASKGDGVKINDFTAAFSRINSSALYTTVDGIFKTGVYSDGTTTVESGFKFATDGLTGLLQDQFITNNGSYLYTSIISSSAPHLPKDDVIVLTAKYLNELRRIFKPIGDLDLSFLADPENTASKPTSLKELNNTDLTTALFPGSTTVKFIEETRYDPPEGETIYTNQLKYHNKLGTVTITAATSTAATATAIIFSAADAKAMISEINKGCKLDYFNGDKYDEIGILANIYVNLNFLYKLSTSEQMESQDSKEKNEINVYNYIKNIASGLNTALGVVANLEIHVDPVDSIGRIIDVNYTDPTKTTKSSLFELQVQNYKSIVRSYSLQSKMFPAQSAVIAIGSQAKGGQIGMQNNTMIDFNKKITDRIIGQKIENETANNQSTSSPIVANSLASIITLYAICHNKPLGGSAYADTVSKCKNALRDIIAYFQALTSSPGSNRNIIPIKFSFTMDGIGGLVIGQLFTVNDKVLPRGYKGEDGLGSTLAQTITGINHKIENSDWTTTIDALSIILDKKTGSFANVNIKEIVKAIIKLAIDRANSIQIFTVAGSGAGGNIAGKRNPGGTMGTNGTGLTYVEDIDSIPMDVSTWIWPVDATVTSAFGVRAYNPAGVAGNNLHRAIDLGCPAGTPVYSVCDGTVTRAGFAAGYGNNAVYIKIDPKYHPGNPGPFYFIYGHGQKMYVKIGDKVVTGQHITDAGNQGAEFSGAHLHLQLRKADSGYDSSTISYLFGQYFPPKGGTITNGTLWK